MQIPTPFASYPNPDQMAASKALASTHALSERTGPKGDSFSKVLQSGSDELKDKFQDFVGQTLFSQMIKAARSTQQPSPYFNGGRAEEIFQGQLDQVLAEEMSDASSEKIAGPMYELFMLRRQS